MELEEAERTYRKILGMLVCAIASGEKFVTAYHFIRPATARDLARLERNITGLVREVLRSVFKLKPRQIPKFYLDLQNGVWKDDGDNTVTVTLDFGKLLPGERPPEIAEACARIMAQYDRDETQPADCSQG
jgi:hypothetical protein